MFYKTTQGAKFASRGVKPIKSLSAPKTNHEGIKSSWTIALQAQLAPIPTLRNTLVESVE